jgi:protocatechuate 3,4-dioxygenase beta subunit
MSTSPADRLSGAAGNRPAGYEGRVLPRPDEEIVEQGLAFDVGTMVTRRRLLTAFAFGAATVGVAACTGGATSTASGGSPSSGSSSGPSSSGSSSSPAEIPDETAGPFPGDGSNGTDVLEQSGIVRSDIRGSFGGASGVATGIPMTLRLTVTDLAGGGVPFDGVAVYVWHCDRSGGYSLYTQELKQENYLRGVQVADAAGLVQFTSVFPACYSGRWPHVHVEVYPDLDGITDASSAIATSQVALPEDVCRTVYAQPGYSASVATFSRVSLATDSVFGDDGAVHQLGTVTGNVAGGYTVSLAVPVDTRTRPGR